MTTKQRRGVETMARVLDAALACFVFRGVYDATIEEVATRSKVSVGSIYHHFGSRERIALLLYRRSMESLMAAVGAPLRGARGAALTVAAGVRAMVRAYLGWVKRHPDEARFIYAAGQTDFIAKGAAELGPFKADLLAPIHAWFAPHVQRGAVVELPFALYEIVIIGPPAEFSRRWLSGAPGLDMAAAIETLPDAVWRSLAARRSFRG